jgi:hypothetical protein
MLQFFLCFFNLALAYAPVDNINFKSPEEINISFYNDINFKASFYGSENSKYSKKLINSAVYTSSYESLSRIESLGLLDKQCEKDVKLEIFEISNEQLNDPKRFPPEYVENKLKGSPPLLGFFDPTNNENKYNAIVVSPHSFEENFKILSHEIAHYWYNRFCLFQYLNETSENFAREIEQISEFKG